MILKKVWKEKIPTLSRFSVVPPVPFFINTL
jgi:hypothetical protein